MISTMTTIQFNMEHEASNISKEELVRFKRLIQEANMGKHGSRKRKHPAAGSDSDEDHGCFALLKRLTCSLQCGGSTCSIKETEHTSGSSKSPTPSMSSLESMQLDPQPLVGSSTSIAVAPAPAPAVAAPATPPTKVRKRPAKKHSNATTVDSTVPPAVKKVKRTYNKKKKQEQQQPHSPSIDV